MGSTIIVGDFNAHLGNLGGPSGCGNPTPKEFSYMSYSRDAISLLHPSPTMLSVLIIPSGEVILVQLLIMC